MDLGEFILLHALLGGGGNRTDDEALRKRLERFRQRMARSKAGRSKVRKLEDEIDELRLCVAALIQLLLEKGLVTQQEMKRSMDALEDVGGSAGGTGAGRGA